MKYIGSSFYANSAEEGWESNDFFWTLPKIRRRRGSQLLRYGFIFDWQLFWKTLHSNHHFLLRDAFRAMKGRSQIHVWDDALPRSWSWVSTLWKEALYLWRQNSTKLTTTTLVYHHKHSFSWGRENLGSPCVFPEGLFQRDPSQDQSKDQAWKTPLESLAGPATSNGLLPIIHWWCDSIPGTLIQTRITIRLIDIFFCYYLRWGELRSIYIPPSIKWIIGTGDQVALECIIWCCSFNPQGLSEDETLLLFSLPCWNLP